MAEIHLQLPDHLVLEPEERVLKVLRPWWLIVLPKYVLTLGLYELWRKRHVLALTDRRVIATQGFVFYKFDRAVPLSAVRDVNRQRALFWAHLRVATAAGELGDLGGESTFFKLLATGKRDALQWGPYRPGEASSFAEEAYRLARVQSPRTLSDAPLPDPAA